MPDEPQFLEKPPLRPTQYALPWCFSALCICIPSPSNASIVHYLPLDGSTPTDVIGAATITIFGAEPTTDRTGMEMSAYGFDGWDDYIHAEININADIMPNITWGAWIQSNVSHQEPTARAIASQDDGQFDRHFGIDYRSGNGLSAFKGDGVLGSYPQIAGDWYFVATTYNETAHQVKLYVAEQDNTSQTGFTVITGGLAEVDGGHNYIHIGSNPFAFVSEHWDGAIDEFFIDDEVLNLEAISRIATNGIIIPEPMLPSLIAPTTLMLLRRRR